MVYNHFPKYVLRTPVLPFSFYESLTKDRHIEERDLKNICQDPLFKEALFLASPILYNEMEKWLSKGLKSKVQEEKLFYSLLKYLSRMCSRCTPFGLFAGTSVGKFSHETNIELSPSTTYNRHTRLDMNYLVALSQDLLKNEEIRNQLLFYPNSSMYEAGHQLRYIEYSYVNSKRIHQIVAVENSPYLQTIFEKAKGGALPATLAGTIVDDEISLDDAQEYVDQLVESQLLISQLEPSVSGPEFLSQILDVLGKLKGTESIISTLKKAKGALELLDSTIGNPVDHYIQISETLKGLSTGFELKYLFQTDMQLVTETNKINEAIFQKVRKAMVFFNKLSRPSENSAMSTFQSSFYDRYGDREVPLAKALDVESGIGFIQGQDSGDLSPLLEGMDLSKQDKSDYLDIKWSNFSSVLRTKLTRCLEQAHDGIQLVDEDFGPMEENWNDLPDTMSSIMELVTIEGEEKVVISGVAGPNGAKLLGRFCHGDPELLKFTQEIIEVENSINKDKILAEIVHLPEARVGNILIRPDFRKYEIPYLARSILNSEEQIDLNDLMISSRPGQPILLRSKRLNKEVIPCLTVAHNYANAALPIYQFLASLRAQKKRSVIGFNWPITFDEYEYLPRVEYHGVIIAHAIWNISTADIEPFLSPGSEEGNDMDRLQSFLSDRKIPRYVSLVDGDNELLINTRNRSSIRMLFDTVRKRKRFQFKEFLHTEQGPAKQGDAIYANQIVVSFYNRDKLETSQRSHG